MGQEPDKEQQTGINSGNGMVTGAGFGIVLGPLVGLGSSGLILGALVGLALGSAIPQHQS